MYTVLVVDDEPANLQMVEYTLSDEYDAAGYSYATDGWV